MSGLGYKAAAFGVAAFAGVVGAGLILSTANAQFDPFAAAMPRAAAPANPAGILAPAPAPVAPAAATSVTRTGFTGVTQAVGASYSAAQTRGMSSAAQLRTLPRSVAPFPVGLKVTNPRSLAAKPRIFIPTYTFAMVRHGEVRASGAGQGSSINPRASKISTVLAGVTDEMAIALAEDAHQDLVRRLTEAGIDVVPAAEVQAHPDVNRAAVVGTKAPKAQNDWAVYGAASAPLRSGHPFSTAVLAGSGAAIAFTDASHAMNAVMVMPRLVVDYEQLGGTGNRTYSGSAQVSCDMKFVIVNGGAQIMYGNARGKGSGPWGILEASQYASDEPFGVLFEVNDRSDDVQLHNAFATAGLGSIYRQSKYYAVEANPDRYAALVRAAYQGLNTAIVAEIRRARG